MKTFALILSLLLVPTAFAADDICVSRPDLCGGKTLPKKKKKRVNETVKAIDDLEFEMSAWDEPKRKAAPSRRAPASAATIDFDAYTAANSTHPAMNRRPNIATQRAFITIPRKVTIFDNAPADPAALPPTEKAPAGAPAAEPSLDIPN